MKNSIDLLKDLGITIPDKIAKFADSGCDSLPEYLSEIENEIKKQAEQLSDQIDIEIACQIREGNEGSKTRNDIINLEELILTLEELTD